MAKLEQKTPIDAYAANRISVFFQSGLITLIMIGFLGGGMYLLDQYFKTFPVLFIIGIVLAYPITQIYLFRKFKRYGKSKMEKIKK